MKKIELNAAAINDWKKYHWNLYASTHAPDKKLLRLWINWNGWFRVVHGDEILYEGTQLTHAIAAWCSVTK